MNVKKFMSTLEAHQNKSLSYELDNEFKVLPYSHMTEIKILNIESVDCGGSKNQWNETVMQLWTGSSHDDGHRVDSNKLLSIVKQVSKLSQLDYESELLVEYGDEHHLAAQYTVALGQVTEDEIKFKLAGITTQCKGLVSPNACCSSVDSACCA